MSESEHTGNMIKADEYIMYLLKEHKNHKTVEERTQIIRQTRLYFIKNDLTSAVETTGLFFKSRK